MQYQVVLEREESSRHYTATVPGMPIIVDATSKREALRLAREAIELFLEETQLAPTAVHAELVNVKV
jgi:predicted RNase H-like HicB family nuclease